MSKTRFAPWVVLACIGTLAGCTSGEGGTAGNTELNVVIPNGAGNGSSAPAAFDIEVVEYTINCDATNPGAFPGIDVVEPTFDPDVTINGALEVLDTASGPSTDQDFGLDLGEVYVWQAFMDIPLDAVCTVQLRARDGDGEVICTDTVDFNTSPPFVAGDTVKVNVLMICDVSYQYPVAMLDLDADFQFNISNFCPDLFVLNCVDPDLEELLVVPGTGAFVYTGCQVRARDGDSQCGDSCDPQTCVADTEGLTCSPGPDNGVSTTVTCDSPGFFCAIPGPLFGTACVPAPGNPCFDLSGGLACAPAAVLNCGGATIDPQCVFTGDTLGGIGDAPPAPLAVGEGGFLVGCTVADDDGNPATPPVALAPGATVTCTAVTTDGDTDCDKTKQVQVFCPGLTPCQAAGPGFCDDGNDCTADSCNDSTGTAVCQYTNVTSGVACATGSGGTPVAQPAFCDGLGECISADCNAQPDPDGSCDDGNECTIDTCNAPPSTSCSNVPNTGASCAGGTGTCSAGGVCVDNCAAADCSDGNACTDDVCTSGGGGFTCTNPNDDTNTCTTCGGGPCVCSAGSCIAGCSVPAPIDAPGIPMACRNSFNQVVSVFPIDLLNVTADDCLTAGDPVNFDIDPVIALDTTFLQAAAETLCDLGTLLTSAQVTSAQVSIDAVAGATCTQVLSGLSPVPQTVTIDITLVSGSCGAGGVVVVNSGVSLPLPPVTLACSALGASGSDVPICSTGTVPLSINLTNPPPPPAYQETFVGVSVSGGAIQVAFACNTSSTTSPAPGTTVSCTAPNPTGACAALPPGNTGATPFPVSDCDFSDGFPGSCTTVPVSVDPTTVCATFQVD